MPKARIYPDFDYEITTWTNWLIYSANITVNFAGVDYLYYNMNHTQELVNNFEDKIKWHIDSSSIPAGNNISLPTTNDISLPVGNDISLPTNDSTIEFFTYKTITCKNKQLYFDNYGSETKFPGATWDNLTLTIYTKPTSGHSSQFMTYNRLPAKDIPWSVEKRLDIKTPEHQTYYAWQNTDYPNSIIYTTRGSNKIYTAKETSPIDFTVEETSSVNFKPFMYCQTSNSVSELKDPFEDFEEWHCGEALYSLPYDKFGDEKLNEYNYNIENKVGKYQKYLSGSAAASFASEVVAAKHTYIFGCSQSDAQYKINDNLVNGYKVGYVPLAGEGHQNCGLLAAGHGDSIEWAERHNIIYNGYKYKYFLEIHISNNTTPGIYAKKIQWDGNKEEYNICGISDQIITGSSLLPENCRRIGLVFTGGGGAAGTAVEYHYKCGSDGVDYSIPGGGGGGAATIWGVLTPGSYILLPARPTNDQGQDGKPSYLLSFSSQKASAKYKTANLEDYYNDLKLCATATGGKGGDKAQKTGTTNGGAGGAPDISRGSNCNGFYCCGSSAGTKGTSFSFNSEDDGSFSCTAAASLSLDITFLDDASSNKQFTTTKENHPTENSYFGNSQIQEIHKGDVDEPVESNKVFCSGGNSYGTGATWNADNSYGGAWYGGGGGCRAAAADPDGTITNAGKDQGGAGYWEIWY